VHKWGIPRRCCLPVLEAWLTALRRHDDVCAAHGIFVCRDGHEIGKQLGKDGIVELSTKKMAWSSVKAVT
jgi:hypothetical protein